MTTNYQKPKLTPNSTEGLRQLDIHLNPLWDLGQNAIVAWTSSGTSLKLLVMPVNDLLAFLTDQPALIQGDRYREPEAFRKIESLVSVPSIEILTSLRIGTSDHQLPWQTVERVIRRYSINETSHRAVLLFDIVGFSKLNPIEQIGQLNSLEYSINLAHRQMLTRGVDIDVARSTTGDGFYVWNRRAGIAADLVTLSLMLLVLAENDLARARGHRNLAPTLRAAYAVGRHYAYHQIEGLSPRGYEYIVGDVTITVARLIGGAVPDQILIGDFRRPLREGAPEMIATPELVARAPVLFRKLAGLSLGGKPISEIKLSLLDSGDQSISQIRIHDKHGMVHTAYNARAEIHRGSGIPVLIGCNSDYTAAIASGRSAAPARDFGDWPGFKP